MGIAIEKTTFDRREHEEFRRRLEENLCALDRMLASPGFGRGSASLGAELEMYIVDGQGLPLLVNDRILAEAGDPQLTPELNRYNLEYNLEPRALGARPFINTEKDIRDKIRFLDVHAAKFGGRIVTVGILPTLRQDDFGPGCMSDRPRYHALIRQLIERRGSSFRIDINGEDPLQIEMNDVTLEGANTSFQVHYRVAPEDFADTYNAFQLVTPLALALAANSASLFGHLLWDETRIPLFKQSIDVRALDRYQGYAPPRVNFGNGWLRRGAFELFSETVRTHMPILPVCAEERALEVLEKGDIPGLHELRLHQGSVWLWNRPVYDHSDGGHLRIEMRALPAGPTAVDMVANAAFLIGLAEGVRPDINRLLPSLPFYLAENNFYRAAQHGLRARIVWPSARQNACEERKLADVLESLLPLARRGLAAIGIDGDEIRRYMGVMEKRLETGQTGAAWQRHHLAGVERGPDRQRAQHRILEQMLVNSRKNEAVSEWSLEC